MPKLKDGTTWGDVYYRFLAEGYDNGYACFAADRWEENEKKKARSRELMNPTLALAKKFAEHHEDDESCY